MEIKMHEEKKIKGLCFSLIYPQHHLILYLLSTSLSRMFRKGLDLSCSPLQSRLMLDNQYIFSKYLLNKLKQNKKERLLPFLLPGL